ncbi:MAG: hypothetical protein NTY39_01695 [Campylobacterales bacterium]|nr:hypothetical protein [Campylobacterales bacterium]
MKMKLSLLAASAILAVGMTGCWTENAPTPAEVAVVAKALDGYILNANGCVDANNNDTCDVGEYTFKTNGTDGGYTIPAVNNTGKVIITGGTDKDTGLAFTGVLKAPKGSTMATPLTTLLADGMDENLVASLFGLSVADLSKDYRAVVEAGGTFSATDAKLNTAALQVQAILSQITALVSAAGTTKSPAEIMKVAVDAIKANTTTTTTLTGSTGLNLTSVMTAVINAIPTTNTITAATVAGSIATSITNTPTITTTTTLAEAKVATTTVATNTATAVNATTLTKAVTLSANSFSVGTSTATFAQNGTFNDQTVSTANDIMLQFTLANNGDELNATAKPIDIAIKINDVIGNRELKAILQGATVTGNGATATITVPANAVLYVEGKDSTGSTTPILVQLTNEAANIYTAPNTFNLSNIMRQIEGKVSSTSPFANITKEGTYNISFLIGGVTLGYADGSAIKALSAPVSTINVLTTTTPKSTFGTTFTGKLTVTQ